MTFQILHRPPDNLLLFCNDCRLGLASWKAGQAALDELNALAEEHRLACHVSEARPGSAKGIMLRKALPGDPHLV